MVQSMTGFASKTITITKGKDQKAHIALHLKTLNSRYFEVNTKLTHLLFNLETELIKRFKRSLYRGYVHFVVHLDNPSIFKGAIEPTIETAKDYVSAITRIKKECKIKDPVTLDMIVRLPNIFNVEEKGLDKQSVAAIMKTVGQLIDTVIQERKKEGAYLKKDLEKRIQFMTTEMSAIEKRSREHITEQKEKLNTLLQQLEGDTSDAAETRKNALYTFLDKIDIHEEIVRFQSHLKNIDHLLDSASVEKGKRLDFTLQELVREINTITAKCADAEITRIAIDIKVEIEKAREQAQNIV